MILNRPKKLRSLGVVVLTALALAGVGCGSGDSDSTNSNEPVSVTTDAELTKAELIAQGDKICEKTDKTQEKELKAYLQKNPEAESNPDGQKKMVLTAGIPPIQTEVEELAALGSPAGDEEEITAIVSGIEEAVEKGEEDPASLVSGSKNPFAVVDKLAGEYGFKACNNAL
jgi:hypothetical protein